MFTEPVSGINFFGRHEILEVLSKRVDALRFGYRQNIALTGRMLSGKSSVLRHFLECLNDTSIVPLYVEVMDEPFINFADKLIATLLYNYFKSEHVNILKDIESLIAKASEAIPVTAELIRDIRRDLVSKHFNRAYRKLLDITSVFKEETGKSCIVVLDEFHNLENFRLKNPFLQLGKIIMIQKNTMYIVSSSQRNTIRKILQEKLSLLFGNFEVIEVSGFSRSTAKSFVRDKISPISISDYYIDYILNITDKNPFYLNIFTRCLKEVAKNSSSERVNVRLLKICLKDILHNPTGILNLHFINNIHFLFEKQSRKQYLSLLSVLSSGAKRSIHINDKFKGSTRGVSKMLEFLTNIDIIFKCGIFYKIRDPFFEFWLRNVYFKKETSLLSDPHQSACEFENLIENDVENYLIEYNKNTLERLRELFRNFDGGIVELGGKMRKLPRLENIEILKYGSGKNYLIAETQGKLWVCQVKSENADEMDLVDFIRKNEGYFKCAQRKILIPLKGIDHNALLLAKEKQIWVWDTESINLLFRLFQKQDFII